jgi:hypothetical protein
MRPKFARLPFATLTLIALAACSSVPITGIASEAMTATQPLADRSAQGSAEIQATVVPSPSTSAEVQAASRILVTPTEEATADDPVVSSYSTVLMIERAADLTLDYLEQIQANQISVVDSSARYPYTYAFPMAMEAFNQTPPQVDRNLAHAWRKVFEVSMQFNQVYAGITQGMTVSPKVLSQLKTSRQILSNYQGMAELYLTYKGFGQDFFTSQQQAVEQQLQKKYGDLPLPTLQP